MLIPPYFPLISSCVKMVNKFLSILSTLFIIFFFQMTTTPPEHLEVSRKKDVNSRQTSSIWAHFDSDPSGEFSVCRICKSTVKGRGTSNNWAHLMVKIFFPAFFFSYKIRGGTKMNGRYLNMEKSKR